MKTVLIIRYTHVKCSHVSKNFIVEKVFKTEDIVILFESNFCLHVAVSRLTFAIDASKEYRHLKVL